VQRSAFPNAYAKHESAARSLMGASGGAVTTSSGYLRPVRGGTVTSGFGPRRGSAGISRNHHGLDIGVPVGSPVYAAAAGRVVRVTTGGNYGTRIEISHEGKVYTLYAHLSGVNVRSGQQVMQGQVIGRSGGRRGAPGAGNSTGPHLHFEVRTGSNLYGNARDPQGFLNGRTTPGAYLDKTTTVPGQVDEQVEEPDQIVTAPYVYVSPIDLMAGETIPTADADPLSKFGVGPPLTTQTSSELGDTSLPEPELAGAGAGARVNRGMF
jgi:murein DD-endopeptidase MepM/ murein hydrolase activator NlpD